MMFKSRALVKVMRVLLGLGLLLSLGCVKEQSWQVGAKAPEISVLSLSDQTVKLSDYRGKPVVLRFWATGCNACVAGMPKLDEFSERYRKMGAVILAVNVGSSKPLVESFARKLKLTYPVLLDPAQIASQKYEVHSVPTTFFIDRKGIGRKVVAGEVTREVFERTMGELMKE